MSVWKAESLSNSHPFVIVLGSEEAAYWLNLYLPTLIIMIFISEPQAEKYVRGSLPEYKNIMSKFVHSSFRFMMWCISSSQWHESLATFNDCFRKKTPFEVFVSIGTYLATHEARSKRLTNASSGNVMEEIIGYCLNKRSRRTGIWCAVSCGRCVQFQSFPNGEEFTNKNSILIYLFMLLFFCEQGISIVSNLEN